MTPKIEKDPRLWLIAIHSDSCSFMCVRGITECCNLLSEPNDKCTQENCPRKIQLGNNNRLEEIIHDT